jgi:hypothetical protein
MKNVVIGVIIFVAVAMLATLYELLHLFDAVDKGTWSDIEDWPAFI